MITDRVIWTVFVLLLYTLLGAIHLIYDRHAVRLIVQMAYTRPNRAFAVYLAIIMVWPVWRLGRRIYRWYDFLKYRRSLRKEGASIRDIPSLTHPENSDSV